jgi:hypothetical protein
MISFSPQNETRGMEFGSSIREGKDWWGGIEMAVKAEEIGNPISERYSGLGELFIGSALWVSRV